MSILDEYCGEATQSLAYKSSEKYSNSEYHSSPEKLQPSNSLKCFSCFDTNRQGRFCMHCSDTGYVSNKHPMALLFQQVLNKKLGKEIPIRQSLWCQLNTVEVIREVQEDSDEKRIVCNICFSDCDNEYRYFCQRCQNFYVCQKCIGKSFEHDHPLMVNPNCRNELFSVKLTSSHQYQESDIQNDYEYPQLPQLPDNRTRNSQQQRIKLNIPPVPYYYKRQHEQQQQEVSETSTSGDILCRVSQSASEIISREVQEIAKGTFLCSKGTPNPNSKEKLSPRHSRILQEVGVETRESFDFFSGMDASGKGTQSSMSMSMSLSSLICNCCQNRLRDCFSFCRTCEAQNIVYRVCDHCYDSDNYNHNLDHRLQPTLNVFGRSTTKSSNRVGLICDQEDDWYDGENEDHDDGGENDNYYNEDNEDNNEVADLDEYYNDNDDWQQQNEQLPTSGVKLCRRQSSSLQILHQTNLQASSPLTPHGAGKVSSHRCSKTRHHGNMRNSNGGRLQKGAGMLKSINVERSFMNVKDSNKNIQKKKKKIEKQKEKEKQNNLQEYQRQTKSLGTVTAAAINSIAEKTNQHRFGSAIDYDVSQELDVEENIIIQIVSEDESSDSGANTDHTRNQIQQDMRQSRIMITVDQDDESVYDNANDKNNNDLQQDRHYDDKSNELAQQNHRIDHEHKQCLNVNTVAIRQAQAIQIVEIVTVQQQLSKTCPVFVLKVVDKKDVLQHILNTDFIDDAKAAIDASGSVQRGLLSSSSGSEEYKARMGLESAQAQSQSQSSSQSDECAESYTQQYKIPRQSIESSQSQSELEVKSQSLRFSPSPQPQPRTQQQPQSTPFHPPQSQPQNDSTIFLHDQIERSQPNPKANSSNKKKKGINVLMKKKKENNFVKQEEEVKEEDEEDVEEQERVQLQQQEYRISWNGNLQGNDDNGNDDNINKIDNDQLDLDHRFESLNRPQSLKASISIPAKKQQRKSSSSSIRANLLEVSSSIYSGLMKKISKSKPASLATTTTLQKNSASPFISSPQSRSQSPYCIENAVTAAAISLNNKNRTRSNIVAKVQQQKPFIMNNCQQQNKSNNNSLSLQGMVDNKKTKSNPIPIPNPNSCPSSSIPNSAPVSPTPSIKATLNSTIKDEFIFYGYCCDICGCDPIRNIRYNCIQCDDFDTCQECFQKQQSQTLIKHKHNHQFKKIDGVKKVQDRKDKIFQKKDFNNHNSVNQIPDLKQRFANILGSPPTLLNISRAKNKVLNIKSSIQRLNSGLGASFSRKKSFLQPRREGSLMNTMNTLTVPDSQRMQKNVRFENQ